MSAPDDTTAALVLRLFGPFKARLHGSPLERRRSRKGEWLLALLVLRHGRPVEREWLAGMLWPESPTRQALALMRRELTDLRRALGSEAGRLRAPTSRSLCLDLTGADVDLVAFDQAIASGDPPSLERAAALYGGPLLEACAAEWVFQERQAREEAYLSALERLATHAQDAGDVAAAERHLRRAVALDPLRESARRRLMQALAAGGNYAAVIETYRELRLRLHREINAEPDPETLALFQRIRAEARGKAVGSGQWTVDSAQEPGTQHGIQRVDPNLPSEFPPLRSPSPLSLANNARSSHNLPVPLTSFVGRERERAEVRRLLSTTHLLTLTGAGGTGKTRLALEIAAELLPEYSDGVWLVELASLSDPSLVPQTVAGVLGVLEEPGRSLIQTLAQALRSRKLLLLLDNCEHLLAPAAVVADALLKRCPDLCILATSREALEIAGETDWRVPPLSAPPDEGVRCWAGTREAGGGVRPDGTPGTGHRALGTLTGYEAVRLFIDRARAAAPGFALTLQNASAVAQICVRLDGIPLAIELAAARVKALSCEQIAARLDDRFRLLTGGSRTALPRHQTLRALIDWSHDLLTEAERALLRRVSVFAGGFSLEAAEAVCSDFGVWILDFGLGRQSQNHSAAEPQAPDASAIQNPNSKLQNEDVLSLLARLVEKSLVQYDAEGGTGRYRLLDTVRQYAADRLWEAGEAPAVQDRHQAFFLSLAETAAVQLQGAGQVEALARLTEEEDNLRAALEWSVKAVDSGEWVVGSPTESEKMALPSSELPTTHSPLPTAVEMGPRLAAALGLFWMIRSSFTEGRLWLTGLLESPVGTAPAARARLLTWSGVLVFFQGDYALVRALLTEGEALCRSEEDPWHLSLGLTMRANVAMYEGEYEAARELNAESLSLARGLSDRWLTASALRHEALRAYRQGDDATAASASEESVALLEQLGEKLILVYSLIARGHIVHRQGDHRQAAELYGRSLLFSQAASNSRALALGLAGLGEVAAARGEWERAARLFGAEARLRATIGVTMPRVYCGEYDQQLAITRAGLGEEAFAAAWAAGQAMTLEQAIGDAGEVSD